MSPASLRRAFLLSLLLSPALCAQAQLALKPDEQAAPEPVLTAPLPAPAASDPATVPVPTPAPEHPAPTVPAPATSPAPTNPGLTSPALTNPGPESASPALAVPLSVPPALILPGLDLPAAPVLTPPSGFTPRPPAGPTPVPLGPAPVVPPGVPAPSGVPAAPAASEVLPAPVTPPAAPLTPPATPLPPVKLPASGPAPVAVRGLWVDGFGPGLKTRAQARQTVEDAARLGVNTLFVQAIRRGDCLCMKSGLPLATDSDLEKNYDPLAVMTKLAHEKGMRVIAWASVTGIVNAGSPSKDPRHVMWSHGAASRDSWLARRSDGTWQEGGDGWLDAGIPAAADYAAQGVVNLVRNYDVDGVQLDRIRYPDGGNWGYDSKTVARFNAEMGARGRPLPGDPVWQQWKREQVTALVRRIALEVKSLRPGAWMTAATITYGTPPRVGDPEGFRKSQPYNDVLQDWVSWVHDGLIDLNVPMNYKRDGVGEQAAWFNGWNAYASSVRTRADGLVAPLAIGTALYLNTPQVSASQAARSVQAGLGWVGYSYRVPTAANYNNRETAPQPLEALRQVLSAPGGVLATPQHWQDAPPSSHGLLGRVTGVSWPGHRAVEAWQGGKLVTTTLTDGNGYYGFLTLPAGKTEVRVGGQTWSEDIPAGRVVRLPDLLLRETPPQPSSAAAPKPLLTRPVSVPGTAKPALPARGAKPGTPPKR